VRILTPVVRRIPLKPERKLPLFKTSPKFGRFIVDDKIWAYYYKQPEYKKINPYPG
jgi:hypothetical protein